MFYVHSPGWHWCKLTFNFKIIESGDHLLILVRPNPAPEWHVSCVSAITDRGWILRPYILLSDLLEEVSRLGLLATKHLQPFLMVENLHSNGLMAATILILFVQLSLSNKSFFLPYRTILSMTSVLQLPIVCSSPFGTVILQFSLLVHTRNESHAAGIAFAISYQVCSFPSFPLFL